MRPFFLVLLVFWTVHLAAADDLSKLEEQIQKLQEEVKTLQESRHDKPKKEEACTCEKSDPCLKVRWGGLLQVDGRFFTNARQGNSTFLIRRARLIADVTWANTFRFFIIPRWDNQQATIHQAYVDTLCPCTMRLRAGLFREPISLDAVTYDQYRDFDERSLAVFNYLQLDDMGAMIFGYLFCNRLEYYGGVFNGRGRQFDNNEGKEFVGRIVVTPFPPCVCTRHRPYFGVSGSAGDQNENLTGTTFQTGALTNFWTWLGTSANPVIAKGDKIRYGADMEWYAGPSVLRAEVLQVYWDGVRHGPVVRRFSGGGWYIEALYVLTGEWKARNVNIRPFSNVTCCGGHGAWEIGARWEDFRADSEMLALGFATGADRVKGPTFAVNWYLNPYMIVKMNWQVLHYDHPVQIGSHFANGESVITARIQAAF